MIKKRKYTVGGVESNSLDRIADALVDQVGKEDIVKISKAILIKTDSVAFSKAIAFMKGSKAAALVTVVMAILAALNITSDSVVGLVVTFVGMFVFYAGLNWLKNRKRVNSDLVNPPL